MHSSVRAWRIPWAVWSTGPQSWAGLSDFHFFVSFWVYCRPWASKPSGTCCVQVRPRVKSPLLPDLVQDGSPLPGKTRAETEWLTTWSPQTCCWPAPPRRRPVSSGCVACPPSAASLCLTLPPAWTCSVGAGPGSVRGRFRALLRGTVSELVLSSFLTFNIWKANLTIRTQKCLLKILVFKS